jgi:hypothetical protein
LARAELESFSAAPQAEPTGIVFLYHSIGSHLLADEGPDDGSGRTHPNGGGLRALLVANNFRVHEATYGSKLGEDTDMFHWLPKFSEHMDRILDTAEQDELLPAGERNRVVMFKSCFPNNYFRAHGTAPHNPLGPALTVENAKASFSALLPVFRRHPDRLFVYLTTPPLVRDTSAEPVVKAAVKKLLGRPSAREQLDAFARRARRFRDWLVAPDGWLRDYEPHNVAVFDLADVLTNGRASNFLGYPSLDGRDPHPNSRGNRRVASRLVPFLNQALRRARAV